MDNICSIMIRTLCVGVFSVLHAKRVGQRRIIQSPTGLEPWNQLIIIIIIINNNNRCLNRVNPSVTGLVSTGALYNVKIKRVCKNNIYP